MATQIKFISKSELFQFERPLAEPEIKWAKTRATINGEEPNAYEIDRLVKPNGDIVWFGQRTNWVKKPNESWTCLGIEENIKPIEVIKGKGDEGDTFVYLENRHIWIPCKPPIYEVLYQEWLSSQNNPKNGVWLYEEKIKEARENNLGEE